MEKIKNVDTLTPEPLMLTDEKSLWGVDIYNAVSKNVPHAEMVKISEAFLMKVFDGVYQNMGKWVGEIKGFVELKGKEIKKLYFSYTTCPKCAKFYGKNYVLIFAQI